MTRRPSTRRINEALQPRNLATLKGRTSVRLESKLWDAYDEVCRATGMSRNELSRFIDEHRPSGAGFTSTVRVFLVAYYRTCFLSPNATIPEVLTVAAAALTGTAATSTAAEAHSRPHTTIRRSRRQDDAYVIGPL